MILPETTTSEYWIIGYGNTQRRDDGIGPYVVNRLRPLVANRRDVHLRVSHQLEPDWIEPLKNATTILFVDAAIQRGVPGRRWTAIQPELKPMVCLGHQLTPAFILGWLLCLYRRCPTAWLVTVEGNDFGFGSGLSPVARKRAEQVIGEITALVLTQGGETRPELPDKPGKVINNGQNPIRRPT
ncbi:hydrogenase maturation protease [uncultured Desulfosarcina sp.]|uniref:hydrogenase maturation protease n=1 Tax=uncultured Desulfosarcina sp. TaxID=218289 RepID=UPI0029C927FE|nr:hydrogenase maturation protease [uncultured Desulfosarcina sp.]